MLLHAVGIKSGIDGTIVMTFYYSGSFLSLADNRDRSVELQVDNLMRAEISPPWLP
jgi:hypothetical protein